MDYVDFPKQKVLLTCEKRCSYIHISLGMLNLNTFGNRNEVTSDKLPFDTTGLGQRILNFN